MAIFAYYLRMVTSEHGRPQGREVSAWGETSKG